MKFNKLTAVGASLALAVGSVFGVSLAASAADVPLSSIGAEGASYPANQWFVGNPAGPALTEDTAGLHIDGRNQLLYGESMAPMTGATFTDFVDVARHLIDAGYTSPERLVAEGGSAGGLLMGAVANLAPELFAGILAEVPFVDALTPILDPSLPLPVIEWEEWGNPVEDPEVYACMKAYSPYENIAAVQYPAILATTSLNDTRVEVTEPAKWVARLRDVATNGEDRPILLKTEMVAGHGGVSGRYKGWRERAFQLAWLVDQAGAN